MDLQLYTPPTAEIVSLVQAKAHMRVDTSADDVYIGDLIRAAREHVEHRTGRQLVCATYRLYMDTCPTTIQLPRPPVVAVNSIKYTDSAGVQQTEAAAVYSLLPHREPAEIVEAYGQSWSTCRGDTNDVVVEYVAGHAAPFTTAFATDTCTVSGRTFADADIVRVFSTDGDPPTITGGGELSELTDYHVRDWADPDFTLAAAAGGAAIDLADDGTGTHFIGEARLVGAGELRACIHAILMLVAHWYEHREAVTEGKADVSTPMGVESLIANARILGAHS